MDITPNELNAQINNGSDAQIVDVREADEVAAGMIAGARHTPRASCGPGLPSWTSPGPWWPSAAAAGAAPPPPTSSPPPASPPTR